MIIAETERFRKSLDLLDKNIRRKVKKQFLLFLNNIFHPSLHTEKLEPKHRNLWSFRIDKNYRVIFTTQNNQTILLLDIGHHDIYKKI